jgi:predicted RND superfamily exporter protein
MSEWIAWVLEHRSVRYAVLVGLALLTTLAGWSAARLRVNGDMTALLKDEDPVVQAYEAVLHDLPELDSLVVLCDPDYSNTLDTALRSEPGVASVIPWSNDGAQERLMQIVLTTPPSDITRTREILKRIRERTRMEGVHCVFGGVPSFLVESSDILNRDLLKASVIAMLGIGAFFLAIYRGLGIFLLTLIPVATGIVWGLGAVALASHQLTLLAAMVPTLLMGIGIDYGIHLAQAARVQARSGRSRLRSIIEGWRAVAQPISIGALTTFVAFAALMASGLRGVSDLGRTGALVTAGVYLASMLVLLSAYPLERMDRETPLDRGLVQLSRWVTHSGREIRWGTLLITLFALIGISRLEVMVDARQLEPTGLEAREVQSRLSAHLGIADAPLVVRTDENSLVNLLGIYREQPEQWPAIRSLSVVSVPGGERVLAYGDGDPFQADSYAALTGDLQGLARLAGAEDYHLSGSAVVNHRINDLLARDWWRLLLIAGSSIGAALVLFTGARAGLLVLLPLVAGVIWTAGAMGWLGIGMSVMSAAVFPLILGLGIDDGVHVILYQRRRSRNLVSLYRDTGVALVATTATTVIAFGAFVFSDTRGLVHFGIQAAIGLMVCLAVSLMALPLFMNARDRENHMTDEH